MRLTTPFRQRLTGIANARPTALYLALLTVCAFAVLMAPISAKAPTPATLSRYIVSFESTVQPDDAWVNQYSLNHRQTSHASLQWLRRASGNARVLQVHGTFEQTALALNALNQHPHVKALAVDALVTPTQAGLWEQISPETYPETYPAIPVAKPDPILAAATTASAPNDPLFSEQWQLQDDMFLSASIDAVNAWPITHGSTDTVIAVIDTGVRFEHPDLVGRLLPGYDFVSGLSESLNGSDPFPIDLIFARSNDGDGRDPDPTDPGDGLDDALAARLSEVNVNCEPADSTWHGTGVASLIAANANDGVGLTGIDWNAMILPVRAVGRCGGHRSDLLDAIRWAAGVEDPALPHNPTPAHIINLSLGIDDSCNALDQAAINDAILAGAIIVSAVGNHGRNTTEHPSSPSQCQHVIGVAATDEAGYLAGYSNYGRDADISAPGGMRYPSEFGVEVATNAGLIFESEQQTWKSVSGTSVAAPLVSGTLGLMRSIQPDLNAERLTQLLLDSGVPFPQQSIDRFGIPCDEATCGAGLLNTHSAVRAAEAYTPVADDSVDVLFDDAVPVNDFSSPASISVDSFGCAIVGTTNAKRDPTFLLLMLAAFVVCGQRKRLNLSHVPV